MEKISLPAYQNGVIRSAAVDDLLVPQNTCGFVMNFNFDRIGVAQTRSGLTKIGATVSAANPILGMTNYRNNAGTNYKLLAKANTSVYAYDGSTWSAVRTTLTAGSKARFTNFVDYVFMVNGNGNEVCSTYNGSGSFGSTNVASLPKGDYIENYRSRIWIADSSNDKLYYSDVVNTDNTITGGTSFIQISPQDGENITALQRSSRYLLVFKQNHIYRVSSVNTADPDPYINRGTYSQESVVEAKDGIYYHHSSGFYKFVEGNQLEISRPIIDIVQAIPRSYWGSVSGWTDDDHIMWSIGDITLEGISYANVVCRYTISTQIWTIYSYGFEIRGSAIYDNGTTQIITVGDDIGKVYQYDSGLTDDGTAINYDIQSHWLYFSDIKSKMKEINQVSLAHENAQGASMSFRKDIDLANKWRDLGSVKDDLFQPSIMKDEFQRMKFRVSGTNVGSPIIIRNWEVLGIK